MEHYKIYFLFMLSINLFLMKNRFYLSFFNSLLFYL